MANSAVFSKEEVDLGKDSISRMMESRRLLSLDEHYGIGSLSHLPGCCEYSPASVLLLLILKNNPAGLLEGDVIDELITLCELYHISIKNIEKSCESGYTDDSFRRSDHLLISDGLISHIVNREYSILFNKLSGSRISRAMSFNRLIKKKMIKLDNNQPGKRLILDFMVAKILLIISVICDIPENSIDIFYSKYIKLEDESSDFEAINYIYECFAESGILQINNGGSLCKEF